MAKKKLNQTFDELQGILDNAVQKSNSETYVPDTTPVNLWTASDFYNAWWRWPTTDGETVIKEALANNSNLDIIPAKTFAQKLTSPGGTYATLPLSKLDFTKGTYSVNLYGKQDYYRHLIVTLSDGTVWFRYDADLGLDFFKPWTETIDKNQLIAIYNKVKQKLDSGTAGIFVNTNITEDQINAENVFWFTGTTSVIKSGYNYDTISKNATYTRKSTAGAMTVYSIDGLKGGNYPLVKSPLLVDQIQDIGSRLSKLSGPTDTTTLQEHILSLDNIDRIGVIGDSYTESHFTIKNKAWINKVSMFTDWNFENFAVSGDTFRGQLDKIRKNVNRYTGNSSADSKGYGWKDISPTLALLDCRTNDIKYRDDVQYKYDLLAITDTVAKLGATPIFCTEYHNGNNEGLLSLYDDLASRYGGYVCDDYTATLRNRGKDHAPFWGGSHPGTRTNELEVTPVVKFINNILPRPYQSIKIFTPREDTGIKVDDTTLDSLVYNTIEDRARIYKEVSLSHSCLQDPKQYDNCTNKAQGPVLSDYLKLKNGQALTGSSKFLVEFILPTDVSNIEKLQLDAELSFGSYYYVLQPLAAPYPALGFYRRFDIPSVVSDIKVGDKFTSSNHGDRQYTVVEIKNDQVESGSGFVNGTIIICSNDYSSIATNSGILTRISDNKTYNYSYSATALTSDYPKGIQPIGHWKKVGSTTLTQSQLKECMAGDKLSVLICTTDTTQKVVTIKSIRLKWWGQISKQKNVPNNNHFKTLPYRPSDSAVELNPKLATTLTSITPADGCIPGYNKNATIYNLNNNIDAFNITLKNNTYLTSVCNKKVRLSVQARYFPPIYDEASSEVPPVTENSFDYKTIKFRIYFNSKKTGRYFEVSKLVGRHWSDIEIPLVLATNSGNVIVAVYTEDKDIQISNQYLLYYVNN